MVVAVFIQAEIDAFIGVMFLSALYLSVRCFVKQKLMIESWYNMRIIDPNEETLLAHHDILALFLNQAIPFYICVVLKLQLPIHAHLNELHWVQYMMCYYLGGIGITFSLLIIFVDYRKGCPCWIRIAPYIMIAAILCIYLVIPAIVIALQIYIWVKQPWIGHGTVTEPWLIGFTMQ